MIPNTEITLVKTFHIAKYLAGGLKIVITIPAVNIPIAEKTREIVPVIKFAVDAEKRKWIWMYFA